MHYVKKALVAACLALTASGAFAAEPAVEAPRKEAPGKFRKGGRVVAGEYMVVLADNAELRPGLPAVPAVANTLAREYGVGLLHTYQHAIRGFAIRANESQARALAADPRVAFVQENHVYEMAGTQTTPPWNLDRIDQESRPLDGLYQYEGDATNVHAYIIDTGILTSHVEFGTRADVSFDAWGGNGIDCTATGHGTFVAGLVGGITYGVAKNVRLHSVRVADCNFASNTIKIVAGVDWVTANAQRPAVANLSFATPVPDSAVDSAVSRAISAGIVFVAAAGNANNDACYSSPARVPEAITVGSTSDTDQRASTSNWGACLDLFAPGDGVISAKNSTNNATGLGSGTSFAAPHVTGAAAILLAKGLSASEIPGRLIADASLGKVSDPGTGSPNRLLYLRPPAESSTKLTNASPVAVSDNTGGKKNFYLDVPAGTTRVTFSITGGSGDADLYVRFNAIPDTYAYDCRPMRAGNEEICTINYPQPGRWYAQLRAYSSYSNVTLQGAY